MNCLNSICFVCLSDSTVLNPVFPKETRNEIFTQVKYTLPELTSLLPDNPIYICSSCHTTLRCFAMFKEKCLENYNRLNDYRKIMQEKNTTPDQSFSELHPRVINCDQLIKHDMDIHVNIEENKDALLSWEEHNQKTEEDDNIHVKEESLASEDSVDRNFYQHFVKIESVSYDEQDVGLSVTNEDNNALARGETNFNNDTDSQDFQCTICNHQVFTNIFTFDTHLRNHINNIKGLKCLICNKDCIKKSHLYQHMKAHLGIRDFECSICKKKFTENGNLKAHMKIHDRIKDYECSICKKKFSQNVDLKGHMKIHEGVDFECSICKKKFSKKFNLKRHMKIH